MQTKLVKDLQPGDKLDLGEGVGTVTRVALSGLFESASGVAYEVEWKDERGQEGWELTTGDAKVAMAE